MSDLERRYLRLLRAYPPDYRRSRGAEIVGTYLDLAGPNRRWPTPGDAADLLRGGLRQRLRVAGVADLVPGTRLAAVLALLATTALAAAWLTAEPNTRQADWGAPTFGPFSTIGVFAWTAWLAAALLHAVAPANWTRFAVGFALVATVAVVPAGALLDLPRPPLFVLVPQVALGLVALALPTRPGTGSRLAPLAAGLGAAAVLVPQGAASGWSYRWHDWEIDLPAVGVALLMVSLLLAAALALRGDTRGLWATMVLLTPMGLLGLDPLAEYPAALAGARVPDFRLLAGTATVIVAFGAAVFICALFVRRYRRSGGDGALSPVAADRCPTCGARR